MTVMNPTLILGPSFNNVINTSSEVVTKLMNKEIPSLCKFATGYVDVRDAA